MRDLELIHNGKDELKREVFTFYFYGNNLYLDEYQLQTRPTKRHRNWETVKIYRRLSHGMRRYFDEQIIKNPDYLITDTLIQEAKDKFINEVKVKIWDK